MKEQRVGGMMRRLPTRLVALMVASALAAGLPVAASPSSTAGGSLTRAQLHYLSLARQGVTRTSRWWVAPAHWYLAFLDDPQQHGLAKVWDTNGLFEALDEIATAQPTAQNRAAVMSFANTSERYWDANLKPIPAYAPFLGSHSTHETMWFDDNGWIGLAFIDAYKATGTRRYLTDAERAFTFIAAEGWDPQGGGVWWNTAHSWRSGESLAAAADLAARLYQTTRKATYLREADKYIAWADKHLLKPHGVYNPTRSFGTCPSGNRLTGPARNVSHLVRNQHCRTAPLRGPWRGHAPTNAKPATVTMPPDGEGAMLAAITTLCGATRKQSWCKAAEKLAAAEIVWLAPFTNGPQYDSVLVRGVLTLYAEDHKARWYRFAVSIARLIETHARTGPGLYLREWDGRPVPNAVRGGLRIDAGSVAVFADLAEAAPPSPARRETRTSYRTL